MHLCLMYRAVARDLSNRCCLLVTSSAHRLITVCAILILAAALTVSGCGEASDQQRARGPTDQPDSSSWGVATVDPEARWLPVLATQDLAVGVKRIAFSLDGLGADEKPPSVRVSLYDLDLDDSVPRSVQYARFIPYDPDVRIAAHGHANASVSDRALPVGRGVYVVPVRLDAAGLWGMLIEMSSGDAEESIRLRFSVRDRQAAPRVGEAAPSVDSRTRADVESLDELTSDQDPEPGLYSISIADALRLDRPLLLTFATPAFCHSRTCAPVLDVAKAVWREFSDSVSGIHVEVFENPNNPQRLVESEAFVAWRLPSEPWVFVIDGEGIIRYAFEGALTREELRSAVEWVVQESGG